MTQSKSRAAVVVKTQMNHLAALVVRQQLAVVMQMHRQEEVPNEVAALTKTTNLQVAVGDQKLKV